MESVLLAEPPPQPPNISFPKNQLPELERWLNNTGLTYFSCRVLILSPKSGNSQMPVTLDLGDRIPLPILLGHFPAYVHGNKHKQVHINEKERNILTMNQSIISIYFVIEVDIQTEFILFSKHEKFMVLRHVTFSYIYTNQQ